MAEQINKINENLYQANVDLVDKNKKLENEIIKLKERLEVEIDISDGMLKAIDKAIEYCENNKEFTPRLEDIIEILKGANNNEQ